MHTTVINAQTLAKSTSYTSKPVTIPSDHNNFALRWTITGDGTGKFEYEGSDNGIVYTLDSATPIKVGQLKTSGPASNGTDMVNFSPWPCEAIKIKVSETAGVNTITVTAVLVTT